MTSCHRTNFPTNSPHHSAVTENLLPLASMKTGTRKLKVYSKSAQRAGYICHYVQVPEIRLCGVWLKEAGFEIGEGVVVDYSDNKITIVREKGERYE